MPSLIDLVCFQMEGLKCGSVAGNREAIVTAIDEALREPADLVCLPETFTMAGIPSEEARPDIIAEPLDGPTITALAKRAREHRCYVVVPQLTRREGRIFNSLVLLDRNGQVAGIYDKRQPVTTRADFTELEGGVCPGSAAGVFDLDFGRVGMHICFDANFPRSWKDLADAGAKLVLWSSAYPGGEVLRAHAIVYRYFVASSVGKGSAVVIDPCGETLARSGTDGKPWLRRQINLDYLVTHHDFHYAIPDRIHARYGERVRVVLHREEGELLIEPLDPAISMAQLAEEFGLESIDGYCRRHESAYTAMHTGQPLVAQNVPFADRPQWRA